MSWIELSSRPFGSSFSLPFPVASGTSCVLFWARLLYDSMLNTLQSCLSDRPWLNLKEEGLGETRRQGFSELFEEESSIPKPDPSHH